MGMTLRDAVNLCLHLGTPEHAAWTVLLNFQIEAADLVDFIYDEATTYDVRNLAEPNASNTVTVLEPRLSDLGIFDSEEEQQVLTKISKHDPSGALLANGSRAVDCTAMT